MDPIPVRSPKRVFDIVVSCILLVLLGPVILFFMVLGLLEQLLIPSARGPLFYREIRISQGKPFTLCKIRTLKNDSLRDAQTQGVVHTKKLERESKNFTLVGALLHQIYIDESPQLVSVLLGDMSLVGPRPTNVESYSRGLARDHHAKQVLRAGLTGRFQTHKHVKFKLNQEEVDMEYAQFCKNSTGMQVLLHDLRILFQTVVTVLRAEGL